MAVFWLKKEARSRIFTNSVDRYSGDDYISGTIGQTRIEFSEVSASEVTKDSKGNETVNRFFWGIFFIGDFNKEFKGQTYVFPDKAERMFGSVARFFQSMDKSRGQLMHLDDPDFEKLFKVYSTDQIESRYILTHSLMQRLINFQTKSKHSISIGFINSNIYIAIPKNRDLLEPRRWGNPVTDKALYEYFEDLSIAISIVEELNLNLRIWTK